MGTENLSKGEEAIKIEQLKQSDATLIISVIGTLKTGNKPNDLNQHLLSSLAEIADSRGTWILSFDNILEAAEFLKMKQTGFNANEKTIQHCEATLGDILEQDDKSSVYAATRSYLLVKDQTDMDCYPDRYDVSKVKRSVVIVVGSGMSELKTVQYAVTHGIPVVVVQGSGSVADCIATGCNYDSFDTFVSTEEAKQFIKDTTDTIVPLLKEILANKTKVHIYNRKELNDIRDTIIFAIKKAYPTNPKAQLRSLAWRWNRIDFARNEKLFEKPMFAYDETKSVTVDVSRAILFATLANDQVDFVKFLLEEVLETDNTAFFNICTLQELYIKVLGNNSANDTMKLFIQNQLARKQESKQKHTKEDFRFCQEHSKTDVVSNTSYNTKEGGRERSKSASVQGSSRLRKDDKCQHTFHLILSVGRLLGAYLNDDNMCNPYPDTDNKRPIGYIDLFLFAVIFNRQRLGELMWEFCPDKLGAALVASSILKTFGKTAKRNLELELSTNLKNHAKNYQHKACEVLTECFEQDRRMAHGLLIKNLEEPFHAITPLALVDHNYLKKFMGHECCQTKLNLIWRGKITTYTSWWKILLALFMPIFIFGIEFTTNERPFKATTFCGTKKPKTNKENTEDKSDEHAETIGGTKIKTNKVTPEDPEDEHAEIFCGTEQKTNKVNPEDPSGVRLLDYYLKIRKGSSKPQLYTVGMFRNKQDGVIQIFDALYYLYTAPFSVYTLHMLSYVIFMFYFSYFIIVDLNEETSFKEYTIWGWAVTMVFEEMRQLITHKTPKLFGKITVWFGSHWNKFDLLIYSLFITTVALRYTLSGDDFQYVRFLYSVTVAMYFMRFLQAFLVAKYVGPKVIMIRKMMRDLLSFLGIFMVFFVSFSVMYQANLYPNSPPSASLLKKLVYKPYWQIFGELFLDEISGDEYGDCTTNATVWRSAGGQGRCPENTRLVIFIGAIYIILTQIVLVNLLIAMFSNTFDRVLLLSDDIWKFYWYGIVREYYERPALCPPLIIFVHIYRTIRHGVKRCQDRVSENDFRLKAETKLLKNEHDCNAKWDTEDLLAFAEAAFKRYKYPKVKDQYSQTGSNYEQ